MKKIIILIFFLLSFDVCSQSIAFTPGDRATVVHDKNSTSIIYYKFNYVDDSIYNLGLDNMFHKSYKEAAENFYNYFTSYPYEKDKSLDALYYSGRCYYDNRNYDKAIIIFNKLIKTSFAEDDEDADFPLTTRTIDRKHDACEFLIKIYMDKKDFQKALKYIGLFNGKYKVNSFCGNDDTPFRVEMYYAECYDALGRRDEAIEILDHHLFNLSGLFDNKRGISFLVELLKEKYGEQVLNDSLQRAYDNLKIDNKYIYINFFNKVYKSSFFIPPYLHIMMELKKENKTEEEILTIVKEDFKTDFTYKLITNN
jgi:tetratricopeptide (TPR) repeat protein